MLHDRRRSADPVARTSYGYAYDGIGRCQFTVITTLLEWVAPALSVSVIHAV
ncbi:hypothetical protein F4553_000604 [Allocatelliglobosispora scoriae]|uniref:Uncharacterized protein n=1 Tax=Allocatelliglobosispora scoriae TaxID=643052 RepID=A0A841BHX7_9ACTN|nr:hypothetical protein [Allocatelliglobosispora scoriae]